MDLVISIDNSTAHLAAALGIPTWLLLPFAPDWRWLLERDRSPWYPPMRIFRQPRAGDWHTVLDHVQSALEGEFPR
jgi:ADP-heptose:LPS heptosyltransferase